MYIAVIYIANYLQRSLTQACSAEGSSGKSFRNNLVLWVMTYFGYIKRSCEEAFFVSSSRQSFDPSLRLTSIREAQFLRYFMQINFTQKSRRLHFLKQFRLSPGQNNVKQMYRCVKCADDNSANDKVMFSSKKGWIILMNSRAKHMKIYYSKNDPLEVTIALSN